MVHIYMLSVYGWRWHMVKAAALREVRMRADKDGCLSGPAFSGALNAAKEQGGDTVGLTPADDMVLKSSYYSAAQLARLKGLAERKKTKEAVLLREALEDVLRKYDRD